MFDTDPDQMERRLSQWTQRFSAKADQFHAMREQVEQVQVTESSTDGAVRVTVDSTGALTDLSLSDRIADLSPPELAAQVMRCLRRAQQQLALRVQEAMHATVGNEEVLVEGVVSRYRQRFGEALPAVSTAADPAVLELGGIDDDTDYPARRAQPQSPRRLGRLSPSEDDEYFANRGYLR